MVTLVIFSAASHTLAYGLLGAIGIPLYEYLRKDIDKDAFRGFQEMGRLQQAFALMWYLGAFVVVAVTITKRPELIDYVIETTGSPRMLVSDDRMIICYGTIKRMQYETLADADSDTISPITLSMFLSRLKQIADATSGYQRDWFNVVLRT